MSVKAEHLKIVIVGHVDHGKSTLIGRLFYDTDSLPEEKAEEVRSASDALGRPPDLSFVTDHLAEERAGGLTIDTAQAFFKSARRRYAIIDAPGHVEFVRNMITGASQAEAAVLVVDAADGIRDQTRRHAWLLGMLGLQQVLVAVNKMDLAGWSRDRFEELRGQVADFMPAMGIARARYVPISAATGDNVVFPSEQMPWHEGPALLEAMDEFEPKRTVSDLPLRFPIQDAYELPDIRVLVGRIEAGSVRAGQEVVFLPSAECARIRSIEILWRRASEAGAGQCIGITLEDRVGPGRGEVACDPASPPETSRRIGARLFWLAQESWSAGQRLELRIATQQAPVELEIQGKMNSSSLEPLAGPMDALFHTEVAEATLTTPRPMVVEEFNRVCELGRFVLVRDRDVVAGGIITRPQAGG